MHVTTPFRRGWALSRSPSYVSLLVKQFLVVLLVGLGTSIVGAADDDARPQRPDRPARPGGNLPEKLLKEFDADNNGRLDDGERAKLRAAMAQRQRGPQGLDRRELMKRFDQDGDGRLNEEERQAALQAARGDGAPGKRPGGSPAGRLGGMMQRFDKDGDGKLSESERNAARAAFAKLRGARPDGPRPAGARPEGAPGQSEFLKRFDKDGDGKLDATERAAARAAFEARGGSNRRGTTDAAPKARPDTGRVDKQALLKEFDADGDGKLTGEERAAARKAFEAQRDKEPAK